MATYNELIFDILELVEAHQITDDTDNAEDHIVFLYNQQRALWLRNEFNKPGRKIDPHLEQDLGCVELELADAADCCEISTGCKMLRTKVKIPATIELHSGPAITRVGPINKIKRPFTFDNYQKVYYTMNGKYTGNKGVWAFLLNDYMYLVTKDPAIQMLEYINVRGVFQDPQDLESFQCEDGSSCFTYEDEFPVNNWMLPYMKEQVLMQLGVSNQQPKDMANDAQDDVMKQ